MKFPTWTVQLLVNDQVITTVRVVAKDRASALRKAQRQTVFWSRGRVEWRVVE